MKRIGMAMAILIIVSASVFAEIEPKSGTETGEQEKHFLYQWTDDSGNVHITDTLGRVPEKYRSQMRTQEVPKAENSTVPQPGYPVPSYDSDAPQKAHWQNRLRDWKERLQNAESEYENLSRQRDELFRAWGSAALAPIENRLKAEQIEKRMKEVQNEMDKARNMIEEVIPEEARKADVPPGWLRE